MEQTMAFKIGDTVQLKSGGPIMTVTGHGKDGNGNPRVNCTWFDKTDAEKNGAYPENALNLWNEGEPGSVQFGIA